MPTINLAGKAYEVDEDGFLQELDKWSSDFAKAYAKEEGIEGNLTDEHWKGSITLGIITPSSALPP
ncbi:MAG: sulfur relay protein, TusE/DsrC/DsvC family [Deltaproteobacteria bacterium]|nr:sulfur relay protein, TusE/DsrC/DsvC family [Deltaproteobacteria bacterium]